MSNAIQNTQKKSGYVAIVGRPNVGKSTILNAILGSELSIVTPKAQTTRDSINGILTDKQGQIVFTDTPGIHRAKENGVNAYMMTEVRGALEAPEVIWYLIDPDSEVKHEERVLEILQKTQTPVFLIFNKIDIKQGEEKTKKISEALAPRCRDLCINVVQTFFISARRKKGLEPLLKATWDILPEGPMYYDDAEQISDRPTRFYIAEKIREQLFMNLGDELPYSAAIRIDSFNEKDPKMNRIKATIIMERDSQKGMVIGTNAQKIKEIGMAARKTIEKFLGTKVFLGLTVDVLKDWSKDAEKLKKLGYTLPTEKGDRT